MDLDDELWVDEDELCIVQQSTACQNLWKSVLYLAMKDALAHQTPRHDKDRAIAFITDKGPWYRTVCDFAGFDPQSVHDSFHRLSKKKDVKFARRAS